MPITKKGENITWKEFFARWKKGIANISQLQLTKHQLRGMRIILLGIFCGITICFLDLKNLWWLLIILIGSFYVNIMMYIGQWQKLKVLLKFEIMDEVQDNIKRGGEKK